MLRVAYACGKQSVGKCSLCAGWFWKVVNDDRWQLVSALVGENCKILREIDEYVRVLSCWDSAVFVSAKYRPTRASVEYAGRDTDLGHLIVEA